MAAKKQRYFGPNRVRRLAAVFFLVAMAPTIFFALRSYGSFRLLHSAYEAGAPITSSIRGWMTLEYVAATYRVPEAELRKDLQLPTQVEPTTSLKMLADRTGISPVAYTKTLKS
jgi:hypothetical protein